MSPCWAGGCVRDLLLGQTPADYDVATAATPGAGDEDPALSRGHRSGSRSAWCGCCDPRHPGIEVEIATFRSDGAYVDGRRPESVVFSSPELDASRRDFTINGMFWDPVAERLIDYVGGREDLERRVLRAIGDPSARFREDKLRLLRAVRMAARFRLAIEPATESAVRAMAREVVGVSAERIAQELRRMLVHPSRVRAMELALELGVLDAVIPPGRPDARAVPGQADAARGGPLGPYHAGPLAAAARSVVHAGVRRDPARRGQALHRGRSRTAVMPSTTTSRSAPRSPRRLCGWLKLSNFERERVTWLVKYPPVPRRGQAAPRGQAQAHPRRAGDRGAPGPAPGRRDGDHRRYLAGRLLRGVPAGSAHGPDQSAAAR